MQGGRQAAVGGGINTVKVFLMDGSYKSMTFAKKDTVEDLWLRALGKMSLSAEGGECFFLWAYCDTLGKQHILVPSLSPSSLAKKVSQM